MVVVVGSEPDKKKGCKWLNYLFYRMMRVFGMLIAEVGMLVGCIFCKILPRLDR